MRKFLFLVLFLSPAFTFAQNADSYFHNSARLYINDKQQQAALLLDEGIEKYPNDARLKALREKIRLEAQQSQSQQQKEQQEQQEQEQQGNNGQQQKEQEQKQQEQEGKEEQAQQVEQKEGHLTKEDAQRLLEALMQQELRIQQQLVNKKNPTEKKNVEKDW